MAKVDQVRVIAVGTYCLVGVIHLVGLGLALLDLRLARVPHTGEKFHGAVGVVIVIGIALVAVGAGHVFIYDFTLYYFTCFFPSLM